ncbi:hypothetical protein BDZ45DRAFT_753326 [Acephala macrosclerotiorum]|nr:hypothetical protein BDZ45DRAFT_753326 [Acephala macrosclerotiorum]
MAIKWIPMIVNFQNYTTTATPKFSLSPFSKWRRQEAKHKDANLEDYNNAKITSGPDDQIAIDMLRVDYNNEKAKDEAYRTEAHKRKAFLEDLLEVICTEKKCSEVVFGTHSSVLKEVSYDDPKQYDDKYKTDKTLHGFRWNPKKKKLEPLSENQDSQ